MYKKYNRKHRRPRRRGGVRKRNIKKQGVYRKSNMLVWKPNNKNPLPMEFLTKVRLKAQGVLTVGGAIPIGFNSSHKWYFNGLTLNNLYQPLASLQAGGVTQIDGVNWGVSPYCQPIGHLTLCNSTTYRNYQVLGCKTKFTVMPDSTGDTISFGMVPLAIGSGASAPTNITQMEPYPYAKIGVASNARPKTLSMYIDLAKFIGVDKKVYRNDVNNYSGYYSGAPFSQVGLGLAMNTSDNTAPAAPVGFIIEQEFYVRYWNYLPNVLL